MPKTYKLTTWWSDARVLMAPYGVSELFRCIRNMNAHGISWKVESF